MTDPKDAFRRAMGRFATGVTVITTRLGDDLHGMTANAVTSLSLEPMMVLVCVDKTADTHDILSKAGVFAVNILNRGQSEISDRFAKKEFDGAHGLERPSAQLRDHRRANHLWRPGVPRLPHLDGAARRRPYDLHRRGRRGEGAERGRAAGLLPRHVRRLQDRLTGWINGFTTPSATRTT